MMVWRRSRGWWYTTYSCRSGRGSCLCLTLLLFMMVLCMCMMIRCSKLIMIIKMR